MRLPLLTAAALALALALSACGNKGQADKAQNADDSLTAENIVTNDVTAIDAVTGDAANMAADVDYNDFANEAADMNAVAEPKPAGRKSRPPAENTTVNAATNSAE